MSLWLAKDQCSNEVVALQNALNLRLKPAKPLVLDGIFGPLTEGAVRDFQKCQKLKADGIAGPQTLGELFVKRTVVSKFVLTSEPTDVAEDKVGASPNGGPKVGSPYDPPSFPPPPDPQMPSFEERWRAWLLERPPKPKVPPLPQVASPDETGSAPKTPPPSPEHLTGRGAAVTCQLSESQPKVGGPLACNEWGKFESATEFAAVLKKRPFEFQVVHTFTAAFVKLAPYAVFSGSLFFGSGGKSGLQASIQTWDTPVYEHEWKNMAGEAGSTAAVSIAPALIGSLMWGYGDKHPELELFAGMRFGASWTREWRSRRGREQALTIFTGFALGAVFVGGEGLRGWWRMHPHGGGGRYLLGFEFGPGSKPRRRR